MNPPLFNEDEKLILECVSGSLSYGLNNADSDVDIRGVFRQPLPKILLGNYATHIQDQRSDISYTELGAFLDQLIKNTPAALELISISRPEHVLTRDARFDLLDLRDVISKKCFYSYSSYARSQIKKAKGVNKKSVNPQPKQRLSLLHFAWVYQQQRAQPYQQWLESSGFDAKDLSLAAMAHGEGFYALYASPSNSGPFADEHVNLAAVTKDAHFLAYMNVNIPAFQKHCREFREYWDWVANRNESRYQCNVENTGAKSTFYDTKNMMHLFRLLACCEEIFEHGCFNVYRADDREFLMAIRQGAFDYEELVRLSDEKLARLTRLHARSTLPDVANAAKIKSLILEFYHEA